MISHTLSNQIDMFELRKEIVFPVLILVLAFFASSGFLYQQFSSKDITGNSDRSYDKSLYGAAPLEDRDSDGLPDELEKELETNIESADTDGDSLLDYEETRKYKTNPLKKDSDNDGAEDQQWDERREYAYTIQIIIDLRPPFNIEQMNDFHQDARVLEEFGNNVTRVEVILYPEAEMIINPSWYQPVESEFTQRTYTKNYSKDMQKNVRKLIAGSKTDIQAVLRILEAIKAMETVFYALPVNIYRSKAGEIVEEPAFVPSGSAATNLTIDEIKKNMFFADSMYKRRIHSGCGSISTLRGAMLRSAGIPEKIIDTIPLGFYYLRDETTVKLKNKYRLKELPLENHAFLSEHYFNIVLIGNQWIRVDNRPYTDIFLDNKGLYVKIRELDDLTDYNSAEYYNPDPQTFFEYRPYKYVSITEQEAVYN